VEFNMIVTCALARGRGRGRGEDRATTIVEMVVAMSLFALVSVSLFASITAFTANDHKVEQVTTMRGDLRRALDVVSRDIRSSTTLTALASSVTFSTQVDLVLLAADGVTLQPVRWRLAGGVLRREPLGSPGGTATSSRAVVSGLANTALLRYFDSSGVELVPGVTASSVIANCAVRLRVDLVARPAANRAATTATTDIALRNRTPGALGC
jgi:type II secretory pathway pseudopilin PulG